MRQLLQRGADPNVSTHPDSILATAVMQCAADMVDLLLQRGADPSQRRPCVPLRHRWLFGTHSSINLCRCSIINLCNKRALTYIYI
jgi:ankyrin repeat protein